MTIGILAFNNRCRAGRLPRAHVAWGGVPAGPAYSLPDGFEDSDVWDNAWAGDKGAGGWQRTAGAPSEGLYKIGVTAIGIFAIYSPYYSFGAGEGILVDLKATADRSWTAFDFGLGDAGEQGYQIYIDSDNLRINLLRLGVVKKTWLGEGFSGAWQTLEVDWDVSGEITVTWDGGGLASWTDPDPLTGTRIGFSCNNKLSGPDEPKADNIRKAA